MLVRNQPKLAYKKKKKKEGEWEEHWEGSIGPRTEMMLSNLSLPSGYFLGFDCFVLLQAASNMRDDGWCMIRSNSNIISSYIITQRRRDFSHPTFTYEIPGRL